MNEIFKSKKCQLSAEDCIALRYADFVQINQIVNSMTSTITCLKFKEPGNPEKGFNTWILQVLGTFEFLKEVLIEPVGGKCTFAYTSSDWEWQTFSAFLQEKDELEIIWMVDVGTTKSMLRYGFHADSIKIVVYRKDEMRFHFRLGTSIANSKIQEERIITGIRKPLLMLHMD